MFIKKKDYLALLDEINKYKSIEDQYDAMKCNIQHILSDIQHYNAEYLELTNQLNIYNEQIDLCHIGLYEPIYNLPSSSEYKTLLARCRQEQKDMVVAKNAITVPDTISINDNLRHGRRFTKGLYKSLLTAFNMQCDALINKVNGVNVTTVRDKIYKIAEGLNNSVEVLGLKIDEVYLDLKIAELYICYEYTLMVEAEREDYKAKQQAMREQSLLEKEALEQNRILEQKLKHVADADERKNIETMIKQNKFRVQNYKAGFVYIISNAAIPDAYKIGVTRRFRWEDRVDELSNASVPYKFIVHCVIFTEDCFALESALHREFDSKRVNLVNKKKEFFYVTLQEIEDVVKTKYDPSAKFYHDVVCDDFLISESMRNDLTNV